jgi:hypothetical protein
MTTSAKLGLCVGMVSVLAVAATFFGPVAASETDAVSVRHLDPGTANVPAPPACVRRADPPPPAPVARKPRWTAMAP